MRICSLVPNIPFLQRLDPESGNTQDPARLAIEMRLPVSEQALPSSVRQVSSVPDAVRFRSENFGRISELGKPEGSVSEGTDSIRSAKGTDHAAPSIHSVPKPHRKTKEYVT